MKVVAIAAVADNGVIGSGQEMLWHISEDFRRFKTVTMGHTLVFGRRTFEQIGKLPGRRHIICTRDPHWSHEGVDVATSPRQAVEMAREAGEEICFVAGGGQIYADAFELCDELDITDPATIPSQLHTVKTTTTPDTAAIKRLLEAGEDVPGAHLVRGGDSLTIRSA